MSKATAKVPKVFISYSWTSPEHEEWVVDLATRLMTSDRTEVVLDKWELKEGQDKYHFMESMVTSPDIDKVLIICDSGYKTRADERKGGVGEETTIITKEVYSDAKQEKFIPIVAERDVDGENFVPAYMSSRIYIDLSNDETYEREYDKLIRNIHNAPLYAKPALGKVPPHLFEPKMIFPTTYKIKRMRGMVDRQSNRIPFYAYELIDDFAESFNQLKIESFENIDEHDEEVVAKIDESLQLKDDFVQMLSILIEIDKLDVDFLVEIFEKLYGVVVDFNIDNSTTDPSKFLLNELFLFTITILNKYHKYDELIEFINSDIRNMSIYNREEALKIDKFRFYLKSFDYRKKRLNSNQVSLHSNLLAQRSGKFKNDLVAADILLYYITAIAYPDEQWYPVTYIQSDRINLKILNKMKSKKHFEKLKPLFKVNSKEEFIEKASKVKGLRYEDSYKRTPSIFNFIKSDDIEIEQ